MPYRVLLVDNVGVLTDQERLGLEWRRLLGEFFSARIGGPAQAWADANGPAFGTWLELWRAAQSENRPVHEFKQPADRVWIEALAAGAGRPVPQPAEEWALEAYGYVAERVDAGLPGAATKVRQIASRGVELHTASSNYAADIDGYLRHMGVRELFGNAYGVDLIDRWKNGPDFYAAILSDIGRTAAETAVVDDQAAPRGWAEACRMQTFRSLAEALTALS
jgi:phosphoglycolate phosphatase-like HAD superfamily hydrolase